jgi:hypothetical protein
MPSPCYPGVSLFNVVVFQTGIIVLAVIVSGRRVKREDFDTEHGDLIGHEVHGVATSYQNVHLESHNPVPVIIHKLEEHHSGLEGHNGGAFESLQGYGSFEGHGVDSLQVHGFDGHEGKY